jgi:hypothetical protein
MEGKREARREPWSPRTVVSAAVVTLCGCVSANTYTVPRTLDPGDVQVQVAGEAYAYSSRVTTPSSDGGSPSTSTVSGATPVLPTLGVRWGVADGLELGVRIANFESLAGDAKVRLLRGTFDLAVDPGLQIMYVPTSTHEFGLFYFFLPLLLGVNVSDDVTLVAAPGVAYSIATASSTDADKASRAGGSTDAKATFGFGVNIRSSDKLAFFPEVTCMKGFGVSNAILCMAGCALNIGGQPSYPELVDPR